MKQLMISGKANENLYNHIGGIYAWSVMWLNDLLQLVYIALWLLHVRVLQGTEYLKPCYFISTVGDDTTIYFIPNIRTLNHDNTINSTWPMYQK